MRDQSPITAEEYRAWLIPRDAQNLLSHLRPDEAARVIVTRLQRGEIRAAASKLSWKEGGQDRQQVNALILPDVWEAADAYFPHDLLWKSGDVTFARPPEDRYQRWVNVSFLGVRFEPFWRPRIAPSGAIAGAPERQSSSHHPAVSFNSDRSASVLSRRGPVRRRPRDGQSFEV
jgi:hypothetical protein